MEQMGRIQIVTHVAPSDYGRLVAFAEQRGLVHRASGRANVSGTLREVIRAGLVALETGGDRQEVRHAEN